MRPSTAKRSRLERVDGGYVSVSARRLFAAGRSHPPASANPFRSTNGDNSDTIRLAGRGIRDEQRTCFDVVCKLTVTWREYDWRRRA